MSENNEKKPEKTKNISDAPTEGETKKEEISIEQKLKDVEDKLLRSLAEIENQRRRFEKEIKDALNLDLLTLLKKV